MPRSKVGRTVACSATLVVVLGAGVFALRDAPDKGSVDGVPVVSVDLMEPDRPAPVVALMPDASVEGVLDARTMLSDSDDGRWNDGDVTDTGPFIDADDDAVDYAFGPVSDVGEFLDPDAD